MTVAKLLWYANAPNHEWKWKMEWNDSSLHATYMYLSHPFLLSFFLSFFLSSTFHLLITFPFPFDGVHRLQQWPPQLQK